MPRLFIELTEPNGQPVWIDPVAIERFSMSTDHPGGTLIWTLVGTQEVQESPEEVLRMLAGPRRL